MEDDPRFNDSQFVFDFQAPNTTPFSGCCGLSLIESIKIFGLIRMEFVNFLNIQQKKCPKIIVELLDDAKNGSAAPKKTYNWRQAR